MSTQNQTVDNTQERIATLEKQKKNARRRNIILIILMLLLLLIHLFCCKAGRIGYDPSQEVTANPEEGVTAIHVTQGDITLQKNTPIDIFSNEQFHGEKIIAPHSKGSFSFCVKNQTQDNIAYAIRFTKQEDLPINLRYKLKMDNIYIKGNAQQYVDIEDLNVEDIIVLKDSINLYTLEWYWEDDDIRDTYVGLQKEDQHYTLQVEIQADVYEEKE